MSSHLPEHLARVTVEQADLDARRERLERFIYESREFQRLCSAEQRILHSQLKVMTCYSQLLASRLNINAEKTE